MPFHSSPRREDKAETTAMTPAEDKGGLFGTGLSTWFALPLGVAAAVPALKFDWYVVNEETQLLAVFLAFCVTLYSQGGDAIYRTLDEKARALLKEHNEAEEKVIEALEQKLIFLKANKNMANDFNAINEIRAETYGKLNAAGAVKPQHDFKAQVERVLSLIAVEEAAVAEKAKARLMEEATASVTAKIISHKGLKKEALDSAISALKGGKGSGDPVQSAFVQYFKDRAAEAKASKDDGEEKEQREALIAKVNSVAKNEKFFFTLNTDGQPQVA